MPTRGQKAAAEQATPKGAVPVNFPAQVEDTLKPSASGETTTPRNGMETIGSRLRKRRRDDSPTAAETTPVSKRAYSKKGDSMSGKSGQAKFSNQDPLASLDTGAQDTPNEHLEDDAISAREVQPVSKANGEASIHQQQSIFRGNPPQGRGAPDFNTVIADIINHGETVDNHYASRNYDAMGLVDSGNFHHLGASFTLKTQSLPVLDNLATQVLNIMAKSSYHEIIAIATKPDTDPGQAYATLKSLFDHTKKVYSVQEPFLNPYELGLVENMQIDIIRKANMATFVSSVFGSQDVGFYHLNENFLDTFVADGGRLLKSQAQLFLDLKTQAYISAVQNTDRSREEILEDLFPHDLQDRLLKRRSGAKQLAPSEADFVLRAGNRRKVLVGEPRGEEAIAALPGKYVWEDFLRDVSAYVSKNFEAITGIAARKPSRSGRSSNYFNADQQQQQPQRQPIRGQQDFPHQGPIEYAARQDGLPLPAQASMYQASPPPVDRDDIAEKAAQAAHYAMQDLSQDQGSVLPRQPQQRVPSPNEAQAQGPSQHTKQHNTPQIEYHFEHPLHPNVPAPPPPQYLQQTPYQHPQQLQGQWNGHLPTQGQMHPSFSDQPLIPYPTQSAPTQVLYERARMAATAKVSPNNRRSGHPSQRRPWTTEEESALMAGLDRVKGPHWSQILAMFGAGGTINEVLKDRNQVQLKDKARNLKLFFLKSGIEVPYYLQFVTGELKTRAPAQAAKKEAKEKGTTDEDRAHVEGLMALAAGGSSHGADQATSGIEDNEPRSGHVPIANMGVGVELNDERSVQVPIDPEVTRGANGVEHIRLNTDAPTDGIGEILMSKQESTQQQLTAIASASGYVN